MLFTLLEVFEIYWQKAPTIMGMFLRMHKFYKKSIFLFLVMHPTFIFSIGFAMLSDYTLSSLILLLLKTADIITKIVLIEKIFNKKELSHEMSLIFLAPIDNFLPYIGLLIYPFFIIGALV